MLTIILILSGLTLIALTAIIIYTNYRSAVNRWLGAFTFSGLLWLTANLFANLSGSAATNLIFSRLTLVGASLIPLTFLMFCIHFTAKKIPRIVQVLIALPVVGLLLTTPTKLNVESVTGHDLQIQPGIAYAFLLIILIIYFGWGIILLIHEYRVSTLAKRQQLYYILLGTAFTVIPGVIISGILPIFGHASDVSYGPTVVIFFSIFTTNAIVRHQLLDVRLVIARSLGYAGALVLVASLYGLTIFGIARFIFGLHFTIETQIFISAGTSIAALSFSYVKRVFDRLTNTLFYQDGYDPQDLYDNLNKILVSTLVMDDLMHQISELLNKSLKSNFCLIGLKEITGQPQRIFGTQKRVIEFQDIMSLRRLTVKYHQSVIATDYIDEKMHLELKKILQRNGIAVLVRISPNIRRSQEGLGYAALGNKKSGNPYTSQDFRVLETVANELIIAIQNALHYEEIQNFNQTLQLKVVDATKELRRTNEKLKALDETKDDFISMASHQLRTPLTSVKGYLSMLLDGDAGKLTTTERQMLTQAFVSSQRMVYLISDLLNVSRLRTGKFVIESQPTNLATIISDELAQLKEAAASRKLTLNYDPPKDFPNLPLDETKTRQVVMNFIDNAIYYTPAGGNITIQLVNKPTIIELKVIDDGIGVPNSEQHHLFTKFYRAANARQARPDGTGLGLYMAKKVIIAQGGSIIFSSHEGEVSTFGFSFNKAKLTAGVAAAETTVKAPAAVH